MTTCTTVMPYSVIEFKIDRTTGIIPTKWMNDEEDCCYWPKTGTNPTKINKLIADLSDYDVAWDKYDIRVLGKASKFII